jgi:hypothetical protein
MGFEITVYWNATLPTKLWYDDAGQLIRSIENWSKFTSTFLANGKSLDFQVAGPVITRVAQDGSGYTVSTIGAGAAVAMLTLPGYGRVWGNAGHFTARYNAAGEFIEMTREAGSEVVMDWPPICAYLAPEAEKGTRLSPAQLITRQRTEGGR